MLYPPLTLGGLGRSQREAVRIVRQHRGRTRDHGRGYSPLRIQQHRYWCPAGPELSACRKLLVEQNWGV